MPRQKRQISPLFMGIVYTIIATLFVYLAIESPTESLFEFPTILMIIVATFDYGVAIKMFFVHFSRKKK